MEVRRLETQYPIPRREVYRYLGLRKQTPDPPLQELIEECITELYRVAVPKYLYKIFPIQIDAEHNRLDFGFMQVPSVNLTRNLRDCEKAAVMAATLGADVDRLMHRYEVTTAAKSVILQAAAAALVESVCDVCQEEIGQIALGEGYGIRPRFSPGYGDFSISFQKPLIDTLQTAKRMGLTLTESYMMVPSKSVTAVIGFSRNHTVCHKEGCEVCTLTDCIYRR